MASSSRQQGNDHLKFTSNSPCFFKIILLDTINNGKLGIPRKFVKEHGHSMSSPAMLRVPSGEVWKVELTKRDDKIWFEKGCLEFASHYSVDTGHLLVFRYDGNSSFHVTIFDRSATEIQYPHISNSSSQEQIINMSPTRTKRQKPQPPSPRPHKTMRSTNPAITTENNEFLSQQGRPARTDDKSMSHDAARIKKYEKAEAIERARSTFQSENPFFLVLIHKSYVFRLTIPARFVREHLMEEHCSITLCNSNGKTWIVTYKQKHFRKQLLSYIQNGWGTFVQDNSINVGDVCVFELINNIKISFKVHIYKGQHANCHQSLTSTHVYHSGKRTPPSNASRRFPEKPESSCLRPHKRTRSTYSTIETEFNGKSGCPAECVRYNEKDKGLDKDGNTFKSENSSFHYVMKPTHVGQNHGETYRLTIPCNFAEKHLMKEHCSVILCSSGKTWIANIKQERIRNRFQLYLQAGWGTFVRDNSIQVGDFCSFELINSIQLSFKVVIQKCNAQSCATASPSCPKTFTDLRKARGFQVAGAAKSENPFFSVVLKQSYNRLIIPVNFARQYLKKMQIKVILLLSNGRSWPVKYYQHCIEGPKPFVIFCNGWRRFVEDNNLEAGDVCRFELSKGAETYMNVTVTRKPAVEVVNLGSSSGDETREKQRELHKNRFSTMQNNGKATSDFDDISAARP